MVLVVASCLGMSMVGGASISVGGGGGSERITLSTGGKRFRLGVGFSGDG